MSDLNPNNGEVALRKGKAPPFEDDESTTQPDDDSDLDSGEEESEEAVAQASARFEDIKVELRERTAGHCIIGIEVELVLDTAEPEPDGADDAQDDDGEPDAEYSLDADDVDAMLAEPPPRRAAPMAVRAERALGPTARVRPPQPRPAGRLRFDRKTFFRGYNAVFADLDRGQMAGLHALLRAAEADAQLTDVRWLAYMLATVQHECAGTWRPIEEYGKGAGRPYGKPVVVTDPQGKKYRNVYYGRGYVQLTWKGNYQRMGKLLKNRLLYHPKLALDPTVAYRIMSAGMRRGLFTDHKLGDYIRGRKTDYVNARKIINGLDRAQTIARNAVKLEKVLRRSAVRRSVAPPN